MLYNNNTIIIIIEFDRTNATLEDLYILLSYTAVVLCGFIIMFMCVRTDALYNVYYTVRVHFPGWKPATAAMGKKKNKTCGVSFMYYIRNDIYDVCRAGECEVSHAGRRLFALMADQGERVVFTSPQAQNIYISICMYMYV